MMGTDAGTETKNRMRADLREAMKAGRTGDARLIRALIAAIDNAEAPPLPASRQSTAEQHAFHDGTAEVERLSLGAAQLHATLLAEIREREEAAAEFDRLGKPDRAAELRAEAALAGRYLGAAPGGP